jgi:alcohol dehydrogenase
MAQTGRICVFDGPGTPLSIERAPLPTLAPGEVLVRITCCTLCGSDLHTFTGRRNEPTPSVLGHEILGRVEKLGPGCPACDVAGQPLELGDRVVWSVTVGCGNCFYCARGLSQKCERLFKYGHRRHNAARQFTGGLADYCQLVHGTSIVRVPDDLPDVVACPASCATATVVAAVRAAGDLAGAVVLVQGLGMLGLTACAMLRHTGGVRRIIGADPDAARRELALAFGATDAVDPGDALTETLLEATDRRGVDVAFEFSGSPDAIEAGLPLLLIGGRYVLVGCVSPVPPVAIDPEMIVRRLITLRGVHNYAPDDLAQAVAFLSRHHEDFPFHELVRGSFDLESVQCAFEYAVRTRSPRVAVVP